MQMSDDDGDDDDERGAMTYEQVQEGGRAK
jgi:hypothetical protein